MLKKDIFLKPRFAKIVFNIIEVIVREDAPRFLVNLVDSLFKKDKGG